MSSDVLWTASCNAKVLAITANLSGKSLAEIHEQFRDFERTYYELREMLKRENKATDLLDTLTKPSLRQTLDEFEDFKYDCNVEFQAVPAFEKRRLQPPIVDYKVARYVYTQTDLLQLEKKIAWQIRIMKAKMEDVVVSYFTQVQRRSQIRASTDKPDSVTLGSTSELYPQGHEDDKSILHLWERVDRLDYRLKRTAPHVQSRIEANDTPPRLSPEEIKRIIEPLKARFQKSQKSPLSSIQTMDHEGLAKYSDSRLKRLIAIFPAFTTRQRVFSKDELQIDSKIQPSSENVATLKIQHTGVKFNDKFNLLVVDIVHCQGKKYIVCTGSNKSGIVGILHHLPQVPVTYPTTNHREIAGSAHNTEVSIEEDCHVVITGAINITILKASPLYTFPLGSDMLAFQSALRGRLIRHTFHVNSIESKRGTETSLEHLKFWTDFNGANDSMTFFGKRANSTEAHLEFPLDCFHPTLAKHDDSTRFRMYFHSSRLPTEKIVSLESQLPSPPKPRQARPSISGIINRMSFSKSAHTLTEKSPSHTPSGRKFGIKDRSGSSGHKSTPSVGSIDSQSSTATNHHTPGPEVIASELSIHPQANKIQYFELSFSSEADADLFKREFPIAARKLRSPIEFKGLTYASKSKPVDRDILPESPTSTKQHFKASSQPPRQPTEPSSDASLANISNPRAAQEDQNSTTQQQKQSSYAASIFTNRSGKLTTEQIFRSSLASKMVYRVQGIPIAYDVESTLELLRLNLELEDSFEIDIRALSVSQDADVQTAIVSFPDAPLKEPTTTSSWSFKWGLEAAKTFRIKVDTDFFGLTMLYSPDPSIHEIDICAVSGLGGHAFGSFKERDGTYMWILELLQQKFPCARTMTYGFDTRLDGNTSNSGLKGLAYALFDSISDLGGAPLIFIGHSLGGLVIKQAMIEAEYNPAYHNLSNSVYGALFFGVPNQGMETGAFETVVKDQANLPLIINLRKDVETLTDQSSNFNDVKEALNLHMEYFYETKTTSQLQKRPGDTKWTATGTRILMVSPSSATNNMISFRDHSQFIHPIERNHSEIVKWSPHDPECQSVVRKLREMKERALVIKNNPEHIPALPSRTKIIRRSTLGLDPAGISREGV